jgi:undecaprenyl phosphate-alpha-L-ara4N flippase subunit ArnE
VNIPVLVCLFAVSLTCDVSGQICFKTGMNRLGLPEDAPFWRMVAAVLRTPFIWAGLGVFAIEFVAWVKILSLAPLSLAYPIASLNYCGVMAASRFLLKEPVSRRRWTACSLIALGAGIVGASGGA